MVLNKKIDVRLDQDTLEDVEKLVEKKPEFDNRSQCLRYLIQTQLRREKDGINPV
jgi:Arc/MetJ-type ribon-helix-helix transcriptional regulator